ncbi:MAG: nicotinamide mononucleotide transporter [Alteromonadaceae bacterium]|nr:nicotinamide mononucleotide transporter [Alteromonadaceae bacterium]
MQNIVSYFLDLPLLELLAVLLSLVYVLLAAKGNNWCWPAAFISTALYTFIFYDVALLMDSILNVYYMAMAIYGWFSWQSGNSTHNTQQNELVINRLPWLLHVKIISLLALISLMLGYLMATYTQAAFPYIDTATTVFSVFATYLVAKKVLENWLYWLVIDFVSIYLYVEKALQPTAALFSVYVVLSIYGYWQWHQKIKIQSIKSNVAADTNMVQI